MTPRTPVGFCIRFLPTLTGEREARGELRLGGSVEHFRSDLSYWTMEEYESQWRIAVSNLLLHDTPCALVVSISDPPEVGHVFRWLLYPFGDQVRAHEQVIVGGGEMLRFPGDWAVVPPYVRESEEGTPISEWVVPRHAVAHFAESEGLI